MNIRFACPVCEQSGRVEWPGAKQWQCPGCDHLTAVAIDPSGAKLDTCMLCGNPELYKKKNFPHWLGILILAGASLAFMAFHAWYLQYLAWTVLIASAVIDGALYLTVGDVIVCYRCNARYCGFATGPHHKPFDLGVHERYRQERLRREVFHGNKGS